MAGNSQPQAAGQSHAATGNDSPPSLPALAGGSAAAATASDSQASSAPDGSQLAASDVHSTPPADREHLRPGLLVVGDGQTGPQRYASLRAACAEVKTGDVIELRYNGRREERPISLNNVRFTLRAGEGYRPVVVFRPDEADPVRYPHNMIAVTGGRLVALNVAFELRLPDPEDVPAESWSLFVAERPESLELDSCTLTIAERGEMAAFFAVQAAAGTDSMMAADDSMPDEPGTVHLENCLLRGQATVLRVYDGEPLNFSWENGLAIAGDHFLVVSGSPIAPRHPHQLHVSLEHVTAVVGRGIC
ncbi:MAG TPA: hypothetical protein VIK18_21840, partial [Pirellulales bacterium]